MPEQNASARVGSLSLGITVIALYALFVMLVTFGFGSYIYRTAWQVEASASDLGDASTGVAPDIDNMLFILKREQNLHWAKELLAEDIKLLQIEVSEFNSDVNQSFARIARARENLRIESNLFVTELTEFQYELPGTARSKYENVLTDLQLEPEPLIRTLLDVLDEGLIPPVVDADMRAQFEDMKSRTETDMEELVLLVKTANAASHDIQAERTLVQDKIKELHARRADHDRVIASLRDTLPEGSVARARLSALSMNLPFVPDILMRLVSFPTIFLTLIVTIAAGGLGTVVAFSRRYYSSKHADTLTLSRLFVNVGEGIAAAIAIFLFSGAGMLALTQGGGSGNDVELSPYTVAFIAFLSGFMAEDAFASIQSAGKRIFSRDDAAGDTAPGQTGAGAVGADNSG